MSISHSRYTSLQAGRAISALLIVLHHASTYAGGYAHLWAHPQIVRWFAGPSLGVAFFFVLSGVVILHVHWQDIGNPRMIAPYLRKRILRIYPIYWLVLIPVLAGQWLSPHADLAFQRDPSVILSSILLLHIHSTETNLVVAWTLFHEVMFYGMFTVLLLEERTGIALMAAWLAACLPHLRGPLPAHPPSFFAPLHLLFAAGMFVAWWHRHKRVPAPQVILAVGALLFLGVLLYAGNLGYITQRMDLFAGLAAGVILLAFMELERSRELPFPRWLLFLGDASYSIYLIHYPVISHLAGLCFRLDQHLHLPIALWMLILFSAGVLSGCLLYRFVERPLLQRLRPRSLSPKPVPSAA